ncbi:hypothetical protein MMC28_010235 [Mycoblastus sanguinarius]|nr:hypothetical protein [Mycoblastus sanguinarius]
MATLAAPIATDFQSLPLLVWLATAYLIASAAIQPLCGKLTDIYSRRTGLLIAHLLFLMGNLTCGYARRWWIMIVGRALAGLGGGGLTIIANITVTDLVPPSRRSVWQGIGSLCWGLGNGLGGVLGGYLCDVWNWRLAFLMQVPLTVVASIMVFILMDTSNAGTPTESSIRRVDFLGSLLLITTLVLLLLGLNSAGNTLPWDHPLTIAAFAAFALSFCVFVLVETRIAAEPILPLRLFLNGTVASVCMTNWLINMIVSSVMYYAPIYFRIRGRSATSAGAVLIPLSITSASGSFLTGLAINRTGKYRYLVVPNLLLILAAAFSLHKLTLTTPSWLPRVYVGLVGLVYGDMLMICLMALVGSVKRGDQAVATSLSSAFRSTGTVMGVTLASAVFQNVLRTDLWNSFRDQERAAETIRRIRESLDGLRYLPRQYQQAARDSYMHAVSVVFLAATVVAILSFVSGLFIREGEVYGASAKGELEEQEDA